MAATFLTVPPFEAFLPTIRALPANRPLLRDELLVDSLRLCRAGNVDVYFMPTEHRTPAAKLMLVGITPGWTQMELAYRHVTTGLANGLDPVAARRRASYAASFGGPMRKNLVAMLDGIDLPRWLGVASSRVLFEEESAQLHSTSILRHPVFVSGENFTGHAAVVTRGALASTMVRGVFIPEAAGMPGALIVPMGDYVSEWLRGLSAEGLVDPAQCLCGFPHPSGANGHRKARYDQEKEQLAQKAERWFSRGA